MKRNYTGFRRARLANELISCCRTLTGIVISARGRVRAQKQGTSRGRFFTWAIPHAEYLRFQKEGLLPEAKRA